MPKAIDSLITDIKESLSKNIGGSTDPLLPKALAEYGLNISDKLLNKLKPRLVPTQHPLDAKVIRASELGTKCPRKLWYKFRPELFKQEPLPAPAQIKFIYGDMLEELVLFLCSMAGHEVANRQREVVIPLSEDWKIVGHIDATIDGELIDVKSCSTYSFDKIKNGLVEDSFGYREQLGAYAADESLVPGGRAFFLPIDKTLGNIDLVQFPLTTLSTPHVVGEKVRRTVEQKMVPSRPYTAIRGKDGNMRLDVECSYCPFKKECWPGVRTFITSSGPRYFTAITTKPNGVEVDG